MACRNDDCKYWRFCRVRTNKVIDMYECVDYDHFESIAQDAKDIEREYHCDDEEDDMEEDDE